MDWYDPSCYSIKILDAKYSKVQINDVVNQLLGHLNVQVPIISNGGNA